jgi:hypothetical protein
MHSTAQLKNHFNLIFGLPGSNGHLSYCSKVAFCENKLLALAAMLNFRLALKAQILIRYTK